MSEIAEPQIRSHISDQLPADHPLAWQTVYCVTGGEMVHASNNECMDTWVETGQGPYCLIHFVEAVKKRNDETKAPHDEHVYYVLDEEWGIRSPSPVI